MSIFIVSYAKDAEWLWYCLASIEKFASGFLEVVVAIPMGDELAHKPHWERFKGIKWHGYEEAPAPLGMLDHMVRKCSADTFCKGDLIAHVDADCVFIKPVTPADYMHDGKPVLLMEPFSLLRVAHAGRYGWKKVVDAAIGGQVRFETMCRHPAVHWRKTYEATRHVIEGYTSKEFRDYVLSCKPDYPQGFAEFPTLGAIALRHFRSKYHFIDVSRHPRPENFLLQAHSHSGLDTDYDYNEQGIAFKGHPRKFYTEVLGLESPSAVPRYVPTAEEEERMAE